MATLADSKIVAPKRAFTVVASHAALPSICRVMVERLRRADLAALRHPSSDLVTFGAANFLMLGMVKADAERRSEFPCP